MADSIIIPGIVKNGVITPLDGTCLPEGTRVEIVLPTDEDLQFKQELDAWEGASDEAWTWIDDLEKNNP
jgi:hypothetical protein